MPNPRKRWTVLIYMVADDPQGGELLDKQATQEMDRITKAALSVNTEHLYVAQQVDFRALPGVWRRVIGETTFVSPEANAADPATLYGFFDWAVTECPAEHYLLVFWGHSSGQFGLFADPNPYLYTAQTLTLDELHDALLAAKRAIGKPVDIIAFKDCFMATLETAYELSGLANYLLASSGLVPVVGWPYDGMFECLTSPKQRAIPPQQDPALDAAKCILEQLRTHYGVPANRHPFQEVPYSLLSTRGAGAVVDQLGDLLGKGRRAGMQLDEDALLPKLVEAASQAGDPALVDLGILVPAYKAPQAAFAQALAGKAASRTRALTARVYALAQALGNAKPKLPDTTRAAPPDRLVIDHTGKDFGGVSVFMYPASPKTQRESRLTQMADEDVYRRLAISLESNWADIALQAMPRKTIRPPQQDVSAAVAAMEQLQRLGIGMAINSAAGPAVYPGLPEACGGMTAGELARLAEICANLARSGGWGGYFAGKGTGGFAGKGTGGFAGKGTGGFAGKGTGGFVGKGTGGFVSG